MDAPEDYFPEQVAATYDDDPDIFGPGAVDAVVGVLAELAGGTARSGHGASPDHRASPDHGASPDHRASPGHGGSPGYGRALEFGIGTGRIALPLAARGVEVHGIDLSEAMVARLRAKPGGAEIPVAIGDFATATMDGTFSLAYLVFNTIMNLTTQDAQVACFRNAAAHLEPGGCFVIETRVPDLRRLPPGQDVLPWHVGPDRWVAYSFDTATQAMQGHYVSFAGGRGEYRTMPFRYVWPAELDLMARLAGMRLRDRWAGWTREPFTGESRQHVSVWEKPSR